MNQTNKEQNHKKERLAFRKTVIVVCAVFLSLINQFHDSAYGEYRTYTDNLTGLVIGVMILCGLKPVKKRRWIPFLTAGVAGCIAFAVSFRYQYLTPFFFRWFTGAINAFVYGFLLTFLVVNQILKKELPKLNWGSFLRWAIMMLLMIFSKNDTIWPLWFFVMFTCVYLVELTREELMAFADALCNGIILGFFLLMTFSALFRCFDDYSYAGIVTNRNMAALYYDLVGAALLGKMLKLKKEGAPGWTLLFPLAGHCFVICLTVYTTGRTGTFVILAETVFALIALVVRERRLWQKVLGLCTGVLSTVLLVALLLPVTYGVIRYMPAFSGSPLLLRGDPALYWDPLRTGMRTKIDRPIDPYSQSYTAFPDVFKAGYNRFLWFQEEAPDTIASLLNDAASLVIPTIHARATDGSPGLFEDWGSGVNPELPVLPDEIAAKHNPVHTRLAIYYGYAHLLNLWGHTQSEVGVWVSKSLYIDHPHNVYLNMLYRFGIVAGVFFILDSLTLLVGLICQLKEGWHVFYGVLLTSCFLVFGLLELSWEVGMLSFTLYFLAHYLVIHVKTEEAVP